MSSVISTFEIDSTKSAHVASTALCILGMHRSGTSALTRVINLLGVNIGSDFIPQGPDNPKGFWEHRGIWNLHERILESLNTWYDDPAPLPSNWIEHPEVRMHGHALLQLVREEFGSSSLWGFKDPRACRLLPLWDAIFDQLGCQAKYVLLLRNPFEIARSLSARNGFSLNKSLLLDLLHILEAEVGSRNHPRAILTYDQLLKDWPAAIGKIACQLDLDWPCEAQSIASEVRQFLDPALRHHAIVPEKNKVPIGDPDLIRWAEEVHALLSAAALGQSPLPIARLDQIHTSLLQAMPRFHAWRGERALARRIFNLELQAADLERNRQWLESENRRLRTQLSQDVVLDEGHLLGEAGIVPATLSGEAEGPPVFGNSSLFSFPKTGGPSASPLSVEGKPPLPRKDLPSGSVTSSPNPLASLVAWNRELEQSRWQLAQDHARLRAEFESRERAIIRMESATIQAQEQSLSLAEECQKLKTELARRQTEIKQLESELDALTIENSKYNKTGFRASLDTSLPHRPRPGHIQLRGWCCHEGRPIRHLRISFGGVIVECNHGLIRDDVASALPTWANSRQSGFSATLPLVPGKAPLILHVTLDNGQTLTHSLPHTLRVRSYPLSKRLFLLSHRLARFGSDMYAAARDRARRTGWLALLKDLPSLAIQAKTYYLAMLKRDISILVDGDFAPPQPIDPYQAWLEVNPWTDRSRDNLQARLDNAAGTLPKISVIMPVYNGSVRFLDLAIRSVTDQVYENWELCIADDKSTKPEIIQSLKSWVEKDGRIKIVFRCENGNISHATNSAVELATGDFLCFLDHDDELSPDALGEAALYLADHPQTDYLYSDDDKIDEQGHRFAPQFKPDWSPELLLSYMYLCHLIVVRRELFHRVGGVRPGFEGSQDYDFALRATEQARHIAHLPLILYHWRAVPGSTAVSGAAKPASFKAALHSVQDALQRRNNPGTAYQPDWAARAKMGVVAIDFPDQGPRVAILIPTRNRLAMLKRCLDSLKKTTYRNYEVVIIDNESDEPETLDYLHRLPYRVITLRNPDGKFNFAAINNRAAEQVDADYILFLNNDTEVVEPRWLSRMVGYAQFPGVGAVGARLLYPDGRLQHAGIVHGLHHGLAGHAFKLLPKSEHGYLSYPLVARNYSAVTAACMLTPRKLFLEMGGFDEVRFSVAYNDVDYGFRVTKSGFRCVFCAGAELVHYEGVSRGFIDNPKESAVFRTLYAHQADPFYSPHLSLENEQFRIHPRRLLRSKPAPIRVLLVTNALNYTGAPLIQYELACQLQERHGLVPVVFSIAGHENPLKAEYEKRGVKVIMEEHPLAAVLAGKQTYEEALAHFARILTEQQIQVVYANTLIGFFAVAAAHRAGIPSIWNIHESEGWQHHLGNFGKEISRQAMNCFQYPYRVIFGSDATRQVYEHLNSHHNFTAIHNPLDPKTISRGLGQWSRASARESLGIGEEEIVLLLLGTVCERKGQLDLPQALGQIDRKWHGKIRCFIVGDRPGDYSQQVAAAVRQLPGGLRQRVSIIAETGETARYYRAADLFVCSSRMECFPRVILEAMTYGLPIVTTPVFGIREQVQAGVNGLFYEPGNIHQLASAITLLLENPSMRQQMQQNAPYVLQRLHSAEEVTDAYGQILQEACAIGG